jgi:hypothetical protein
LAEHPNRLARRQSLAASKLKNDIVLLLDARRRLA